MIKQSLLFITSLFLLAACGGSNKLSASQEIADQPINVSIDLVNVADDKVNVTVDPGKFNTETVSFFIPKTVPGTYSTDDYGRLIENLTAFNYDDKALTVSQLDDNSWSIADATNLDYITYQVNDSYDIEGELEIFSPSGTNIEADENYVLNLHGFIGYFENKKEIPYQLSINRAADTFLSTSLVETGSMMDEANNISNDQFTANRYFTIIDNPILVTKTEPSEFLVDDMRVIVDVYSPKGAFTAKQIQPNLENMMQAQKNYLGPINNTPLYAILVYLSDLEKTDANGYGALEHHTSTVVVLPESIPIDYFNETMTDIVSHEFFHTLTPLNVHSEEIHFFDYNDPKMSQHLWMYEGVTEYFANHFQVHEGLISPEDFYERMMGKIMNSRQYFDDVPFTTISANILDEEYKDQFINVYEKGALIAMSLDITLRELSGGDRGILWLMGELSKKYGKDTPFEDQDLIPTIVSMTYPEVQTFFDTYVTGSTPIPYDQYFDKVGLDFGQQEKETNLFLMDMEVPFIDINEATKEVFFSEGLPTNSMLQKLGVQAGDIIQSVNGETYNLDNLRDLIMGSLTWQVGQNLDMVVLRNDQPTTLSAIYETPIFEQEQLIPLELSDDDPRMQLRNAWLFSK